MRVRVKILGVLAKPDGRDELELELEAASNIEGLMLRLGYHRAHLRFILPSVNGTQQGLGHPLTEGDEVVLFLPASGG